MINRQRSDPTNLNAVGWSVFRRYAGQIDNNGSLLLTSSHDGSVTTNNSGALTALSGTINGGVTNSGTFNLAGTVTERSPITT